MTPAEKVFPAQKVEEFCVDVLTKAGLSPDWSAIVAESLLCAEVRGILSHGVVRLES
jgi:LDH2 family malate/lactate/ureidoglycolate dehydrogenase